MFIQTVETPNPRALSFYPGVPVFAHGSIGYKYNAGTPNSPLARSLFMIDGVEEVMFGSDFISVTRAESCDWGSIRPLVLMNIMDHFNSGDLIMDDGDEFSHDHEDDFELIEREEDKEITDNIKTLIETKVRPSVARDGGDIVYRGFDAGIVFVQLKGACSGCPSASVTLKNGVESMLKYYVPEVISVEAI